MNSKGNKIAWRIKKSFDHGPRMVMKFNKKFVEAQVFSVRAGREAHVKATHFMAKASNESAAKMDKDFVKFAEIQLQKIK